MEGFLARGQNLIFPECGETSTLARRATLAACWLHEPHPSATSQLGWGFHTLRGGIDPGDLRFRPRVVGVAFIWKHF